MKLLGIIPARYASTRFPGKPLAMISDKPMIEWVWLRAAQALGRESVIIATEDERIASAAKAFGARVCLTSATHVSGTDRVAEVARRFDAEVYINIQGDEPLMPPQAISGALELVTSGRFDMSTACVPFRDEAERLERSVVKVLIDRNQRAAYFSRLPLPDSFRHVGLYVYRKAILETITQMPPSTWEVAESLEQLRALQSGIEIGVAWADFTHISVDLPEDLQKITGHPELLRLV